MKKKYGLIVAIVIVLFAVALFWFVKDAKSEDQLKHKSITGVILSYEQTSDGLTFVIDDDATTSNKEIIVTDNTMFTDDFLEESILTKETGLCVTIESEFWTQSYDGIYPAVMISPAE